MSGKIASSFIECRFLFLIFLFFLLSLISIMACKRSNDGFLLEENQAKRSRSNVGQDYSRCSSLVIFHICFFQNYN